MKKQASSLLILIITLFTAVGAQASWKAGTINKSHLAESFYQQLVEAPYDSQRRALGAAVKSLLTDGYKIEEVMQPIHPPNGKTFKIMTLEKTKKQRVYKLTIKYIKSDLSFDSSPMHLEVIFNGIVHDEASANIDPHPVVLKFKFINLDPRLPVGGVTGGS